MIYALRDRAKALEDKFAYEQTCNFRTEARRTRLVGLWAASLLNVDDVERYAGELVSSVLNGASAAEIATKLRHDFDAAGVDVPDVYLQHRMQDMLVEARRELDAA